MSAAQDIQLKWELNGSKGNERSRRLFGAAEAVTCGYGGIALMSSITGLARSTIARGIKDTRSSPPQNIRRRDGGRLSVTTAQPGLLDTLKKIVDPVPSGHPMRKLRRVSKSLAKLARAVAEFGSSVCAKTVSKLLRQL